VDAVAAPVTDDWRPNFHAKTKKITAETNSDSSKQSLKMVLRSEGLFSKAFASMSTFL
jgi:hypothetical protein